MSSDYYGFIAGEIADAGEPADDNTPCDGCTCCSEYGCTPTMYSRCPADSAGDSVCPCTEPY